LNHHMRFINAFLDASQIHIHACGTGLHACDIRSTCFSKCMPIRLRCTMHMHVLQVYMHPHYTSELAPDAYHFFLPAAISIPHASDIPGLRLWLPTVLFRMHLLPFHMHLNMYACQSVANAQSPCMSFQFTRIPTIQVN
jgi:hypothetical protein